MFAAARASLPLGRAPEMLGRLPSAAWTLSGAAGSRLACASSQISSNPFLIQMRFRGRLSAAKKKVNDNMIVVVATTDDIPNLAAKPGNRIRVKRGYFRNFLLPKGKAVYATPENLDAWKVDLQEPVLAKSKEAAGESSTRVTVYDTEYANRVTRFRLRFAIESDPNSNELPTSKSIDKVAIWRLLRRKFHLPHLTLDALTLPDNGEELSSYGQHTLYIACRSMEGNQQNVPFRVDIVDPTPAKDFMGPSAAVPDMQQEDADPLLGEFQEFQEPPSVFDEDFTRVV